MTLKEILFPKGVLFFVSIVIFVAGISILLFEPVYKTLGYSFIILGIILGAIWGIKESKKKK